MRTARLSAESKKQSGGLFFSARLANPSSPTKKKTIAKAIVFFSYIRLTASDIASQLYSAKAE